MVRAADKKSPREAVEFILQLLKVSFHYFIACDKFHGHFCGMLSRRNMIGKDIRCASGIVYCWVVCRVDPCRDQLYYVLLV